MTQPAIFLEFDQSRLTYLVIVKKEFACRYVRKI